jgi:hypothetical protein
MAGVILSINAPANEMQVRDLETKKPVTVKLVADSSMKKIQPPLAQQIAAQLHPDADNAAGQGRGRGARGEAQGGDARGGRADFARGGRGSGFRQGGSADLQTLLDNSPNIAIADLKAGDAIVVSSTVGTTEGKITAIKLFAGVEPILTKPGTKEMQLGSWSLGGFGGGEQ